MSIFSINETESNIKSKSILNMINEDTYLTGDIHFNHGNNDNDTYYDEVVESINSRVSTGSCLILMGDICDSEHDGTDKKVFTKFINDINCKNIILVLGNNDRLTIEEYKEMGIKYINTRIDCDNWVFTHEPITVNKGVINFHAHIHGSREYWNIDWHNHIDVFYKDHGCQVLTIKEYLKLFKDGKYDGKTIIKAPHESSIENGNGEYLTEAAWKSARRYRCPYCDYIATKAELILHLEKKHEDMIPENYSAGRVLFEFFNKKDHGICRICGKPTKWNENKLMFEQICDDPKCKKAYSDEFHKVRMVKKYGVESLLNDPKMQQKMLANRKISGYYKFSDGVKISYCGKYELKLLEFCDKVLGYKSYEITSPGPVIEYEYEGKTLKWITDQYIGPANLVIDAKDGGNNPNKREMPEYRAKQIAKEETIKKLRKYNYIRLTDNNFAQLIEVLMDIKFELSENPIFLPNPVININEDAGLASGPIGNAVVGMDSAKHIISYKTIDPMFSSSNNQYALSFDDELNDLYVIDDDGKVKHESVEFLFDKKYSLIKPNNTIYKKDLNLNETVSLDYFLNLCNTYQLESTDIYRTAVYESEIECATLKSKCMITKEMEDLIDIGAQALPDSDEIIIKQDPDGFFLYNTITEFRTASRSDKNKLLENEELISIIKNYKKSQED